MKIEDLKKIVNNEGLKYANICLDRYYAPEEMVIKQIEGKWIVGVTTERAGLFTNSIAEYNSEEEACEDFLRRLKILNELKNSK